MALRSGEKIVVCGYSNNGSNAEFGLARCHVGVVLSTVATLNALTASGGITQGSVPGAVAHAGLCSRHHGRHATVPHTSPYAWLTPTANDSAFTLWVRRIAPG